MKQEILQIRISDNEKKEIYEVVTRMADKDLTVSRFIREAIREKIAALDSEQKPKTTLAA